MKKLNLHSLRSKFLIQSLLMILIAIIWLNIFVLFVTNMLLQNGYENCFSPVLTQAEDTVDNYFKDRLYVYEKLGTDPIVAKSEDTDELTKYLISKLEFSEPLQIALYEKDGTQLCSTKMSATQEYAKLKYFKQVVETGEGTVTNIQSLDDGTEYYIAITPIFDTAGNVTRIVATSYDFAKFQAIIDSIKCSKNSDTYLINSEGEITSSSKTMKDSVGYNPITVENPTKRDKELAQIHKEILASNKPGEFERDYKGKYTIIGHRYIDLIKNHIVILSPRTDFVSISFIAMILIIVDLVLIVGAIVSSLIISGKFTKPILNCIDRIKLLANGDLKSEVEIVKSKDEMRDVTIALRDTINSLSAYTEDIVVSLNYIAKGDLTHKITSNFIGDFEPIETNYNYFVDKLSAMFERISIASNQVSTGANQLSDGSQEISQGATEQASSIEQVSGSVKLISEAINKNASDSAEAMNLTEDSEKSMNDCINIMEELVEAMGEINKSSKEVSNIIKVIDDIAFQTNILSLNAAVEAARAGAAGKGFAVVADEIRTLASKTADSSKQTTQLINRAINGVTKGTELTDKTAQLLETLGSISKKSYNIITGISQASKEQADSISKINGEVGQITTVIQNNSATTEQSAAATEELSGQAELLNDIVSSVKFNHVSIEDIDQNQIENEKTSNEEELEINLHQWEENDVKEKNTDSKNYKNLDDIDNKY